MPKLNIKALREGQQGGREWLEYEHPPEEWKLMLEGAYNEIDKLLDAYENAYANGIGVGRRSKELLDAEMEGRKRNDNTIVS